jgi:hypothetical protein
MNNLNKKNQVGDLMESMIVMLVGLPVATGLLYLLMLAFDHSVIFSFDHLTARLP